MCEKQKNTGLMVVTAILLSICIPGFLFAAAITVNGSTQYQTIDGFGAFGFRTNNWSTPSSWWNDSFGNTIIGDLGLTIHRNEYYPPEPPSDQDTQFADQAPYFQLLKNKAAALGEPLKIIITVWTPPAAWKSNGSHKNGGNLLSTYWDDYGNYVADALDDFAGIGCTVYGWSLQNEPLFAQSYNSCVYTAETYRDMLKVAGPIIHARYPNVKLYGAEHMMFGIITDWDWDNLEPIRKVKDDSAANAQMGIWAMHGYSDGVNPDPGSQGDWTLCRQRLDIDNTGRHFWMTETSGFSDTWTGNTGAFALGTQIFSGLKYGHLSAWVWWQLSDSGGGDYVLMDAGTPNKKYYASKQFYRYIRPDAIMVDAGTDDSTVQPAAFKHNTNNTMTIVLVNSSTSSKTANLSVSGPIVPTSYTGYRTSSSENCVNIGTVTTSVTLPATSITTLYGTGGATPPGQASSPSPANGATGVSVNADLSWTAGSGATSHDVYFGTDSTPDSGEFMGNQAGTTYALGTLAASTTYYWRIDEKNAAGTTTGVVWSFTTGTPPAGNLNVIITADDSYTLWVNGTQIGSNSGWESAETYNSIGLQAGENVVAVQAVDTGYEEGVLAELIIDGVRYGTSTSWKVSLSGPSGWQNPGYNDSSWANASDRGAYGGAPWGTGVAGMPTDTPAHWIWSAGATETPVYVRYKFNIGAVPPGQATSPSPANGATSVGVTTDLSWTAGSGATSHDVYFGTVSPGTFRVNQTGTTYDTGTMANNTTYYWRIDEKNTAGTTTGAVWSFTTVVTAPGQASNPSPANGAASVSTTADLSWTAGSGATSHDVYFGTVSPGTFRVNQTGTTYDTGTMANSTTYYWRIDEKNAGGTTTGVVWSFTTQPVAAPGPATNPSPANGATGVSTTADLSWTAGSGATSHDVYFGTLTTPPFIQNQAGTTYDTGTMAAVTTYYWRIDEKNAGGTTTGTVWSFTTVGGGGLPSPWVGTDIGSPGAAGSASYSSGTFTVNGSGADIAGTSDAGYFVYQPISGNCTITARVVNFTGIVADWAKAGVMIRETLNANSMFAFGNYTTNVANTVHSWTLLHRDTTGGSATQTVWGTDQVTPYWIRVVRSGSSFSGYVSSNGSSWTLITTATISMASNVYVGMAVTSHLAGSLSTATFDNVSVTTGAAMPTFVAAGAVSSSSSAITPALPSGIATNDILLLFLETGNQAISISNQNGGTWTAVTNSPQSTGGTRLTAFWSRYNGTQGAPTTSDSGDHQLGRMIAIRGAITSGNPWDVTAGGVEATSDTSGSIPGATTTVANTLVVAAIATDLPDASGTANFSSWTNANLSSVTERTDNTVTSGNGGGLGIATGGRAATGAYGNTTVTAATSAVKAMMSIALKGG